MTDPEKLAEQNDWQSLADLADRCRSAQADWHSAIQADLCATTVLAKAKIAHDLLEAYIAKTHAYLHQQ